MCASEPSVSNLPGYKYAKVYSINHEETASYYALVNFTNSFTKVYTLAVAQDGFGISMPIYSDSACKVASMEKKIEYGLAVI